MITRRFATFESEEEFCSALSGHLVNFGLSWSEAPEVASGLAMHFVGAPPGYRVAALSWIIREDDLKLLEYMTPAAIAISTAVADRRSGPATVAAVATSIATLLALGRQLIRHAIRLNRDEYELVLLLRKSEGGLSAEKIQQGLGDEKRWTLPQVQETLAGLTNKRSKSGDLKTIASRDSDGRWHVVDI